MRTIFGLLIMVCCPIAWSQPCAPTDTLTIGVPEQAIIPEGNGTMNIPGCGGDTPGKEVFTLFTTTQGTYYSLNLIISKGVPLVVEAFLMKASLVAQYCNQVDDGDYDCIRHQWINFGNTGNSIATFGPVFLEANTAYVLMLDKSTTATPASVTLQLNSLPATPPPAFIAPEYQLVWGDEFNLCGLDLTKWRPMHNWGCGATTSCNSVPRYCACTCGENIRIANGICTLVLDKEPVSCTVCDWSAPTCVGPDWDCCIKENMSYSTGVIHSRHEKPSDGPYRNEWKYGYFELRYRIPEPYARWRRMTTTGVGPTWWFWGDNHETPWSEIDMFEVRNGMSFGSNIHITRSIPPYNDCYSLDSNPKNSPCWSLSNQGTEPGNDSFDITDGEWHTFGMEWTPRKIEFRIDGNVFRTYEGDIGEFLRPMTMIITNELIPNYCIPPNQRTKFPYNFEIDYVRIWQLPSLSVTD